jgi:hypothetical protein
VDKNVENRASGFASYFNANGVHAPVNISLWKSPESEAKKIWVADYLDCPLGIFRSLAMVSKQKEKGPSSDGPS